MFIAYLIMMSLRVCSEGVDSADINFNFEIFDWTAIAGRGMTRINARLFYYFETRA